MKAIVLHETAGPASVRYDDAPEPEPGEGEVVVRLAAAALNRRDLYVTQGLYPGIVLPAIMGSDGAGVIASVGRGVGLTVGTDVVIDPTLGWGDDPRKPGPRGFTIVGVPFDGTFSEYVKVPAANVYARPTHLSAEEAAALPLAGLTAYRAVVTRGEVGPGTKVLVPGVGGGVAVYCVQIAAALGAQVWVTSSSDEKLEGAKALGALGGVNSTEPGWAKSLKELAGTIDVVIDSIGGPYFKEFIRVLAVGGRIVSFGATAGPVPELVLPTIFLKHIDVLGTAMGSPAEFKAMLELFARHELRPLIAARYPLAEAARALSLMESGGAMGKIVLDVA